MDANVISARSKCFGSSLGAKSTTVRIWLLIVVTVLLPHGLEVHAQPARSASEREASTTESGKVNRFVRKIGEIESQTDHNRIDKYNLVFVTNYNGTRLTVGEDEADRGREARLRNFREHLNALGERGSKLLSVVRSMPVAILRSDEVPSEYDWIEITSSLHFAKSGLSERLNEMNARGFRLVEHFFVDRSCELISNDNPEYGDKCRYKDVFLFEKARGKKKAVEQILIGTTPAWGGRPSDTLGAEIGRRLAEGYYPVRVLSRFEILMERVEDKVDLPIDGTEVKVVRSDIRKTVNELAKQGYRLAMTNNGIAVMYRNRRTVGIPISYVWLRADKKEFDRELAKLQEKGAVYRAPYTDEKGDRNTLIFEQDLSGKGEHGEFKVLKFEFESVENKIEGRVRINLTPTSKEAVKAMNSLAKEGYAVRDLFYSDKVSVILERIK